MKEIPTETYLAVQYKFNLSSISMFDDDNASLRMIIRKETCEGRSILGLAIQLKDCNDHHT